MWKSLPLVSNISDFSVWGCISPRWLIRLSGRWCTCNLKKSPRSEVSKVGSMSCSWPTTCFCKVCELRMVPTFSSGWKIKRTIFHTSKLHRVWISVSIKLYWNTVRLIQTLYGYFHAIKAKLSSYDRDHMACIAENIYCGTLINLIQYFHILARADTLSA